MAQELFEQALLACSILVHKHMDELLKEESSDSQLVEAMRYSALSSGKRIRPFLVISTAELFGVTVSSALNAAAAIEFIHVYSLIHDDLPAMDNDDLRRGKPTSHKKFNEATAILAGDALLTFAFEILSESATSKNAEVRCELIKTLAKAAGFKGMVGGQMIDLEKAKQKISDKELIKLHRLKTGELFMAAVEIGAILGRADSNERRALHNFAHDLGLAFQIKDDILDHRGTPDASVELDETNHKKLQENTSIVDVIGLENAVQRLELLKNQAITHLKIFGNKAALLKDLTEFVVSRQG